MRWRPNYSLARRSHHTLIVINRFTVAIESMCQLRPTHECDSRSTDSRISSKSAKLTRLIKRLGTLFLPQKHQRWTRHVIHWLVNGTDELGVRQFSRRSWSLSETICHPLQGIWSTRHETLEWLAALQILNKKYEKAGKSPAFFIRAFLIGIRPHFQAVNRIANIHQ